MELHGGCFIELSVVPEDQHIVWIENLFAAYNNQLDANTRTENKPLTTKPRLPTKDSHSTFILSSTGFAKNSFEREKAVSIVSMGSALDKYTNPTVVNASRILFAHSRREIGSPLANVEKSTTGITISLESRESVYVMLGNEGKRDGRGCWTLFIRLHLGGAIRISLIGDQLECLDEGNFGIN